MKLKKLLKKLRKFDISDKLDSAALDELYLLKHKPEPTTVFTYDPDESTSIVLSYSMRAMLCSGIDIRDILKDCSMYLYGYTNGYAEEVLAKNTSIGRYPFNDMTMMFAKSGTLTRFEVVSNDDPFCYFGGNIGTKFSNKPMKIWELFQDVGKIIHCNVSLLPAAF